MNPLWSINFEEQFYLVWPLFVAKPRRVESLVIASGCLLVVAEIARLILLRYARHSEVAVFTNTLARLDPIALGILTAVWLRARTLNLGWPSRLAFFALGIAVWLLAGHYFGHTLGFMLVGYPAMALGAWFIFVSTFGVSVAPRWLRYLGKISYGLYVFHMLGLYLAVRLRGGYAKNLHEFVIYWWLGLALTLIMAVLSYRFFESPFLRLKERFTFVESRPV
jgi:peptidoglycan/LPS O-acetylase OafA/YrhL